MPDFTYDGLTERYYTGSRDALGQHVGTVRPGDIRDLDEAPDQWWHETTGEDRAAAEAAAAGSQDSGSDESGTDEGGDGPGGSEGAAGDSGEPQDETDPGE